MSQSEHSLKKRHQKVVLTLLFIFYHVRWLFSAAVIGMADFHFTRLGVSALITSVTGLFYLDKLGSERRADAIVFGVLCVATVLILPLASANPDHPEIRFQLIIATYAIALLVLTRTQLLAYIGLVVLIDGSLAWKMGLDHVNAVVFMSHFTFFCVLWFVQPLRILASRSLETQAHQISALYEQQNLLIGQLGHDLRTPLVPLTALLPKIEARTQDKQLKSMLAVVSQSARYMRNLVERVTLYSFHASGDVKLHHESFALFTLVSEAFALFEHHGGKPVSFELDVPADLEVWADRNKVLEVLHNLLSNAIRYSFPGGKIRVAAQPDSEEVRICVRDFGTGMTAAQKGQAFEAFFKGDKSRQNHASVGLGLAICRSIISKHGYGMSIESAGLGRGTAILFSLKNATAQKGRNHASG